MAPPATETNLRLMRAASILAAIAVLVGCGGKSVESAPTRIPEALATLTLVEGHPNITPAVFPHAAHIDAERMGGEVECATCHHLLEEKPEALPRRCTSCHGHAYLQPVVDEAQPHEHAPAPDL